MRSETLKIYWKFAIKCIKIPSGKGYFFSWRDPALKGVEEDWLGGRNYCRKRCMDLVSLETSAENEWIKKRIVDEKVSTPLIINFNN